MYRAMLIALTAIMITSLPDAHSLQAKEKDIPVQAQIGKTDTLLIPVNTSEVQAVVYTVPANKHLIIDYAGGDLRGRLTSGFDYPAEGAFEVNIQTTLNQVTINHDLGFSPVFRGLSPDNPRAAVAREVQFFADPGTPIRCTFRRNYRGVEDNVGCSISGRLVDTFRRIKDNKSIAH
jgi:hypothetical protein